jgi:hypothetical protein
MRYETSEATLDAGGADALPRILTRLASVGRIQTVEATGAISFLETSSLSGEGRALRPGGRKYYPPLDELGQGFETPSRGGRDGQPNLHPSAGYPQLPATNTCENARVSAADRILVSSLTGSCSSRFGSVLCCAAAAYWWGVDRRPTTSENDEKGTTHF